MRPGAVRAKPLPIPKGDAALLSITVALRSGTPEADVLSFPKDILSQRNSAGSPSFLPGISAIVPVAFGAHRAYDIIFDPAASPKQRALVMRRVQQAAVVCVALANVYPEELARDTTVPCDD